MQPQQYASIPVVFRESMPFSSTISHAENKLKNGLTSGADSRYQGMTMNEIHDLIDGLTEAELTTLGRKWTDDALRWRSVDPAEADRCTYFADAAFAARERLEGEGA